MRLRMNWAHADDTLNKRLACSIHQHHMFMVNDFRFIIPLDEVTSQTYVAMCKS